MPRGYLGKVAPRFFSIFAKKMVVPSSIVVTILVILAFILYSKSKKIKADRYLMAFFLTIALGVLNDLLWELIPTYYSLFRFGSITVPLAAAFLYLYSTSLISSKKPSSRVKLLLFLPALMVLITNIFVSEKDIVMQVNSYAIASYYFVKIGISALVIVLISIKINKYSKRIKNCFSDIENIEFKWLKFLVNSSLVLFGSIPLGFVFLKFLQLDSVEAFAIFANILIFIFVFTLAFYGIKNTNTFKDVIDENIIDEKDIEVDKQDAPKVIQINSSFDEQLVEQFEKYMLDNKPYLNERITIAQLSEDVSIPQRQLSHIINSQYEMNFFDFINSFRIKEFNKRVEMGDSNSFTILAIAFDCGFSSKSAFNRAYKKHIGVPPSEFAQSGTYS